MVSSNEFKREAFLSQVEKVRTDIRDKFSKSRQILDEKESILLSELDQLAASYRRVEFREEIQQLSSSKESIISVLKGNENHKALELSISPLNARIRELEVSLGYNFGEMGRIQLENRLNEMERIRIILQVDCREKEELVNTTCKHTGILGN